MPKLSPLQRVREEHGSKDDLATKVIGVLEKPEDEEQADFEGRIRTLSNKKLLRLWESNQRVQDTFGSKDALVQAIVTARFPGGNDDYTRKISGFSLPKLLDLARQHKLGKG